VVIALVTTKGRCPIYSSLRPRGGSNRPAALRARPVPADLHEGSYRDFLRRHESESATAARKSRKDRDEFALCLFRRAADPRNIRCAIDHVAREGGTAPGPNGLRPTDLDRSERWDLARALSRAILERSYVPGPHREVDIPKGPGRGYRTLRVQNVEDRVVQRALVQTLQPFLDPRFSWFSFGYRPRLGREHALATVQALAEANGRWAWVVDDIKDAFDQVPHGRLIDALRSSVNSPELTGLIGVVIGNQARRGLRQGGSLSPLLLNAYLDHHLDRPWVGKQLRGRLVRVADDLLVLGHDRRGAERCHAGLTDLLRPAGFSLKGDAHASTRDLQAGEEGEWLGFSLRKGPRGLEARPTERVWSKLDEHLALAHTKPDAPVRAYETIVGWVEQLGPCEPHLGQDELHHRIVLLAREHAFEEIPTREYVASLIGRARARYLAVRALVLVEPQQEGVGGSARPRFLPTRADNMAGAP